MSTPGRVSHMRAQEMQPQLSASSVGELDSRYQYGSRQVLAFISIGRWTLTLSLGNGPCSQKDCNTYVKRTHYGWTRLGLAICHLYFEHPEHTIASMVNEK